MHSRLHNAPNARRGFTLVELMVVLVIISILSALTLSGLAGARQRAKIDKTKSTIRKLHEIVMPQYESYQSRRVPQSIYTSGTNSRQRALDKLRAIRSLTIFEMPDSWSDIATNGAATPLLLDSGTIPSFATNGTTRRYGAFRATLTTSATTEFGNAECLYLITSMSGFAADAMEQFRSDEISDTDKDKAPEFIDAWQRPIRFIRWAPGFSGNSLIQSGAVPDPCDPFGISGPPQDYALIPLIFSAGPDGGSAASNTEGYGITGPPATGWASLSRDSTTNPSGVSPLPGYPSTPSEAADNITNHDLISKR